VRIPLRFLPLVLFSFSLSAQNFPSPSAAAYPSLRYEGRFLDSTQTGERASTNWTLRSEKIRVAADLDRVFVLYGGQRVAAWQLSSFIARLTTEPLSEFVPGGERHLPPDLVIDPLGAGSGWNVPSPNARSVFDFALDDRGNVVVSVQRGFGIVNSSGTLLHQEGAETEYAASMIEVVRSGAAYYLLACRSTTTTEIWNITDPAEPTLVRTVPFKATGVAAPGSSGPVGVLTQTSVMVFDREALVAGSDALFTLPAAAGQQFTGLTSGGDHFYAVSQTVGSPVVSTLHVVGNADPFDGTTLDLGAWSASGAMAANGYLTVWGRLTNNSRFQIYSIDAETPLFLGEGAPEYHYAGAGYVQPYGIAPVSWNGDLFAIYSLRGLGEVYRLGTSSEVPSIVASGPTSLCQGQSVTLSATTAPTAGTTYLWSPGGQTTRSISINASGTYTVSVSRNNVTNASQPVTVTVNAVPPLPLITAVAAAAEGEEIQASVEHHGGNSYLWTITNGTIVSGQGTALITVAAGTAGVTTVKVVELSSAGCSSPQATASVQVTSRKGFYTLTPCRLVDTRLGIGPAAAAPSLAAQTSRLFDVTGKCGLPPTAKALSLNVTVVDPGARGHFRLYPADEPMPLASTINFGAWQTRANNTILRLAADGSGLKVFNGTSSTANVIIDVNGWFE
jgi:hypothetical protein